jgi:hypothetical protein
MPRTGISDPTEATWTRTTTQEGAFYAYAHGKFGNWRFRQQTDGHNCWTEEEMLRVDDLMRRVCYVDRARWHFTRFTEDGFTCHFSADAPSWQYPGLQSDTLDEFLARLEMYFLDGAVRKYGYKEKPTTCQWCEAKVQDDSDREGMTKVDLLRHAEREHPEELEKVRAEQLARMETLRGYYRRRDETYHPELDGPREPRTFIL